MNEEKAEEPDIQLPTSSGSLKNQEGSRKTSTSALLTITSRQIDRETMETVTDFIFLFSKITAEGECSHEIKTYLLLGRKAMINLESIVKGRDITLLRKVHLVKAMVFPGVMYGCESWTIKKVEKRKLKA